MVESWVLGITSRLIAEQMRKGVAQPQKYLLNVDKHLIGNLSQGGKAFLPSFAIIKGLLFGVYRIAD